MRIEACYDSHVHWPATGEFSHRLTLHGLKSAQDILSLKPAEHQFRGEWVVGFGWDETAWPEKPTRAVLDRWFPDRPVALSRCDGHALWTNSEALRRAGLLAKDVRVPQGGRVERDANGEPTGILVDQACELVDALIPPPTGFEMRRDLLKGVQIFNEAGFTHIRDMTCDEVQWNEACRLDQAGLLTLAVEEFFWVKSMDSLDKTLALVRRARKEHTPNLRAKGIKIFLDGALGSNGAWISRCYHGEAHNHGLKLWDIDTFRDVIRLAWESEAEVAVHAIGDEAADVTVDAAVHVRNSGFTGRLHIEHAELLRPETVQKMRGLGIECHLQPAHWLSDRRWLKDKLGDLVEHAFPWRRLQEAEVPFDFGSDAPIEPASLARTFQAIRESAEEGIPRLLGSPVSYMSHKDLSWAPNSFTILDGEAPKQVVFRGEHVI